MTLLTALSLVACSDGAEASEATPVAPTLSSAFWDHWGDGRAELSGYRLKTPRYGEIREGRATLVVVTETFTDATRVKSDGRHDDEYPVLKLNEVRDFQTGIYDYNVMTSSFLRLDGSGPIGEPVKVSMGMQEWCGHVYEQLVPRDDALTWTSHSYFDGEADRERALPRKRGGVLLDALPLLVRGLVGPLVKPGARATYPALPTLTHGRLAHTDPRWTTVSIQHDADSTSVTVPAGTFETTTVHTSVAGGASTTWSVETAWPHRLIRWERSDGEVAELLGVERLAYWQRNREGDESLVEGLGHPRPAPAWR
ncbi:MAG: hypothetical protein KTR31_25920 [Myxococcales bacterium]|nr:hypothetical protein [Myxococcales bacterium]